MRRIATLGFVLASAVSLVGLAACGDDSDDEAEPTTTTAAEPVAPLTGLPDPEGTAATRPALWVKVGNQEGGARPQSGLDAADIVYEEIAEGGVTRFAAIFNSVAPPRVGPVRSVRVMDPNLMRQLLGILAYSGGTSANVDAINAVTGLLVVDETAAGEAMERSSDRPSPDNLYALPDAMFALGGEPKPPRPLFEFLGDDESFEGDAVQSFVVGFDGPYAVTYSWDEAQGLFMRSYGTDPFVTAEGAQIGATNVIVQFITYEGESAGNTIGEGDAWVFSQGKLVEGRWQRATPDDVTSFVTAEGETIKITPGRTWIALFPTGETVDVVAPPPPPPPSS